MYIFYHGGFIGTNLTRGFCELAILDPKSADMKKGGAAENSEAPALYIFTMSASCFIRSVKGFHSAA